MPKTFEKEVQVQLTPAEVADRKDRLVAVDQKIREVTDEKKEAVSGFNEVLKGHKAEQEKLLNAIETGVESMALRVFEQRDERRGHIQTVRVDTGAVVEERAMTQDERQMDLPGADDDNGLDDPGFDAVPEDSFAGKAKAAAKGKGRGKGAKA